MGTAALRRLIVGTGGSGRTHHLRVWSDAVERQIDGQVVWIRGTVDQRSRANAARRLLETLDGVAVSDALAVDDAHWLPDAVIERLLELAPRLPVAVARSPWPESPLIRELDEALTVHDPTLRLERLDDDGLRRMLDELMADDETDRVALIELTAGSPGLVHLLVEADTLPGNSGDVRVSSTVVDSIVRRARASGLDVLDAVQMMRLGADLATAAQLAGGGDLERRLRASGLVHGDRVVPVAGQAIDADMTEVDRAKVTAVLSGATDALSPTDRASLIHGARDAFGTVDHASAAVFLGAEDAAQSVGALDDLRNPDAARSAFILDMRSMRWERAGQRPLEVLSSASSAAASDTTALAAVLGGVVAPTRVDVAATAPVDHQVLGDLHNLLDAYASGADTRVTELGARLVDDAMSSRVDIAAGWSPAAIAGALMMSIGQPDAARRLLRTAIGAALAGPGEQSSHHLLAAHADIACGDFSAALDLVRAGARPEWQLRDHFLLAALDAAIARRSGDTARLRDAWKRSSSIVDRQSQTWLLLDPTVEVLAAGARVGDAVSIGRARSCLSEQVALWPEHGPARAMVAWTDLQIAVASENWPGVQAAAARLEDSISADARTSARRGAATVWASVAARLGTDDSGRQLIDPPSPASLDAVVDALVSVGDAWEASRLLGQVALDHPDSAVARTMLERARLLVTDPVEAADGLVAAGLSEREAEVARLVAEGRTYKAIGSQLFISAKTVEHHVARLRQRLGASSRAELLAMIRELTGAS